MTEYDEKRSFKLKPLSKDGIETALNKAEHYRLLNQPLLAESICRDILMVESENQKAAIFLLLSLADQFGQSKTPKEALEIAGNLKDPYHQKYYGGIVHERQGMAALSSAIPGSNFDAFEWYLEAMELFEEASAIQPANMEPVMRWNTCARVIMNFNLKQRPKDDSHPMLE
ncbi:MAG TPA: hypothetical protein VGA21_03375 [Cyclobacteriaceae bacterium]|jgi:hypothetical protein